MFCIFAGCCIVKDRTRLRRRGKCGRSKSVTNTDINNGVDGRRNGRRDAEVSDVATIGLQVRDLRRTADCGAALASKSGNFLAYFIVRELRTAIWTSFKVALIQIRAANTMRRKKTRKGRTKKTRQSNVNERRRKHEFRRGRNGEEEGSGIMVGKRRDTFFFNRIIGHGEEVFMTTTSTEIRNVMLLDRITSDWCRN